MNYSTFDGNNQSIAIDRMKANVEAALAYCRHGFNALPLKDPTLAKTKSPAIKWRYGDVNYTVERFTERDIRLFSNRIAPDGKPFYSHGVIAITGISNLHCFDFDHVGNFDLIGDVLVLLGLPVDYPWVLISGSRKGFQVWFFNDEGDQALIDTGLPCGAAPGEAKSVYDTAALDESRFKHVELRWQGNCCVMPPSIHPSGNRYSFRSGEMPEEAPMFASVTTIKAVLDASRQAV